MAETDTDNLALTYVELREVLEATSYTGNVQANATNGLVEVWIDPPNPAAAVANIRLTSTQARDIAGALIRAANALDPHAWVHLDGTPCEDGPLVAGENFCAEHDQRIKKEEA